MMDDHQRQEEPKPCPSCAQPNDCMTGVRDEPPKVNDITVCFYCAHVGKFDEHLNIVDMSPQERAQALRNPTVATIVAQLEAR